MNVKCCLCGKIKDRLNCVVLTTTEDEMAAIRQVGQEPSAEYIYCRPCYRLATDRERAARFMQGIVQMKLRARGNPKAEAMGNKMYEMLIDKSKKVVS
jgi:hypothetical protein